MQNAGSLRLTPKSTKWYGIQYPKFKFFENFFYENSSHVKKY